MKVYISATKEAGAMGGALLARFAWWKGANVHGTFEEMTAALGTENLGMKCVAEPQDEVAAVYKDLVPLYTACEEQVMKVWEAAEA